jgi:hypothetical protein
MMHFLLLLIAFGEATDNVTIFLANSMKPHMLMHLCKISRDDRKQYHCMIIVVGLFVCPLFPVCLVVMHHQEFWEWNLYSLTFTFLYNVLRSFCPCLCCCCHSLTFNRLKMKKRHNSVVNLWCWDILISE